MGHLTRHGVAPVRLLESDTTGTSLERRVDAVRSAIWARNESTLNDSARWYPVDVYDAWVIVRRGETLFRVPYTMTADGAPQFGEPEPVAVDYTPVKMQESDTSELHLVEGEAAVRGKTWDVTLIAPGWSKNGFYYSREVLAEAAPLFEGIHVFYFPDSASGHKAKREEKVQRQLVGWIDQVEVRESDGALTGQLHFLQEGDEVAKLRINITDAWDKKQRKLYGLSIDANGGSAPGTAEGRKGRLVEGISSADSVDIVRRAAAGGQFTRLVASATATTQEGGSMKLMERLVRFLEARRPDALSGIDRDDMEALEGTLTEAERGEFYRSLATPPPAAEPTAPATTGSDSAIYFTRIVLRDKLQESKLPDAAQKRIRARLDGHVLAEEKIQEAIDDEREYLAELHPARPKGLGVPGNRGQGGAGVAVGPGKIEKLQEGLRLAFGLPPSEDPGLRGVRPIGIRAFYQEVTGGADPTVTGTLQESVLYQDGGWGTREMLQEGVTTATFPRTMANVMHQALRAAYGARDFNERRIITSSEPADDFREYESVNVGGMADLSDFTDETADYQEIAPPTETNEKYSVGTKGNILTISRRTIIGDKIGTVKRMIQVFGEAARRTHAKFVWNRVLLNPTMTDGVALFHASRGNLSTTAYSIAALEAIALAMYNVTEPSGVEKLELEPYFAIIPRALRKTVREINASDKVPGSANNDANDYHEQFGAKHENIIVCPFMSDANDYIIAADPTRLPMVEMRYLFGQEEPELFVADSPTEGQMLIGDRQRYKIRHEYGGVAVDPRAWWKAVVA